MGITLKDTHREKGPSNKTSTLSKNVNMDVWVVGTSNQLNKSNFALNPVEMVNEATIYFYLFDESHFSNICIL